MSTDSEWEQTPVAAADALRLLARSLAPVEEAAAATEWGDAATLAALAEEVREEVATPQNLPQGDAAVAAVERARAAVADALRTVAELHGRPGAAAGPPVRCTALLRVAKPVPGMWRRYRDELRHVFADRPRAVLVRLAITVAISLSLVSFYHLIGWASYDNFAQLTLYLFSGVVGSIVCTNALCFEADRVRTALVRGDQLWQVLVTKNLAMATLVGCAGLPVIVVLTLTADVNPVSMVDQLLTMVFIWLGVANVLSVVYPLRHEPVSARLHDGTWRPYLFSFAISYGVGLTVNLMIYWRLWARQTAASELAGGVWAAFVLVLVSSVLSWVLLTVLAIACSRDPQIRRLLSREMVAFRKPTTFDSGNAA